MHILKISHTCLIAENLIPRYLHVICNSKPTYSDPCLFGKNTLLFKTYAKTKILQP